MRLYCALLVTLLAAYCWPDRNVANVPFSELTLNMIARAAFSAWLGYHAIKLAFASLEKDSFWPWKWTFRIVAILCIRLGMLVALGSGIYVLISDRRIGSFLLDHFIVTGLFIFLFATMIICYEDDELVGPNFLRKNAVAVPKQQK